MAAPSLTYTLVNATTADASQVMQNFNDLLNGMTDSTRDLSINTLAMAGNLTVGGTVTFGNSTTDDFTVSGSLAASIPIKTNNSFDIGSATLGLASIYLGAPSSRTTRLRANQSLAGSHTLTLPDGGGSNRQLLKTDGSGNLAWVNQRRSLDDLQNISVSAAADSGAHTLTFTLKSADGTDLSATNEAIVPFRHATLSNGTVADLVITSNLTLTIPNTATLGHKSGQAHYIYIYLFNNSGTPVLSVSSTLLDQESTRSSATLDTSSDVIQSMYTPGGGLTSKPCRIIARARVTEATAGVWDTAPDFISLWPFAQPFIGAAVSANADITLSHNTLTTIPFQVVDSDSHNGYLNGVYTAPMTGYWQIETHIVWAVSGTGGRRVQIDVNGSVVRNTEREGHAVYQVCQSLSHLLYAAAGTTFEIKALQTTTGNFNAASSLNGTRSFASFHWLGDPI